MQAETLEDRCLLAFDVAANYLTEISPQAIVTADYNGDLQLDLATANYNSGTVSVLLGNPDGTFGPANNSPAGSIPASLAVGDFNEDGDADLAVVGNGEVRILIGNGNGTFQPPASQWLDTVADSVAVGDFNADGNLDLGVTSNTYYPGGWGYWGWYPGAYYGRANVLIGTGSGSFTLQSSYYLGYGYHAGTALADLNTDGNLDYAVAGADGGYMNVLQGDGAGGLTFMNSYYVGYGAYDIAAGDVSGDGKADLLAANLYSNDVHVAISDGTGSFSSLQFYDTGAQPTGLALGDFNADGRTDIATSNTDGSTSVLLGTTSGTFTAPALASVGSYPTGIVAGDIDGNGFIDVATANGGSHDVSVLLNDGGWPNVDAPRISINDISVVEGNLVSTTATFTVSLSSAPTEPVSVHFSTTDGSATIAGGDYQSASGDITFGIGETNKLLVIAVSGDRIAESTESLHVGLSNATNAFISRAIGTVNITDDEPLISIDYGPTAVTEGNAGTTTAWFTVRLAAPYDVQVSVNLSTVEGDTDFPYWGYYGYYAPPPAATANMDFQSQSGPVTFNAGQTEKLIPITIHGDLTGEQNEYFSVNLDSPSVGTLLNWHGVGLIIDDEPQASVGYAQVTEGNTGTVNMNFTVTLSAPPVAPVTVTYATSDGNANQAVDYQAVTGTLNFGIGETSKTISVPIIGDRIAEYDEYLQIELTGSNGASIANGYAYGTILDDEPRLSINSVSVIEGNSGTKTMTFTVTMSSAYDQAVTVNYATYNDSATAGSDYIATSGTLTFNPGQTTRTFTVTIKGDKQKEADEYFYVLLDGVSSNARIYNAYGSGTILTDEPGKGQGPKR